MLRLFSWIVRARRFVPLLHKGQSVWAMSLLKTLSDPVVRPFQLHPPDVAFIL